jgi:hypothetical protein
MTAVKERMGLLEFVVKEKLEKRKIEILVEKQGDKKFRYHQMLSNGKTRSMGVYALGPKAFSNLIELGYLNKETEVESKRYFPYHIQPEKVREEKRFEMQNFRIGSRI